MGKPASPPPVATPNIGPPPAFPTQASTIATPPTPYDPRATAQTQFDFAKQAAEATRALNLPNWSTPYGSLATSPSGEMKLTLTPAQQALLDQQTALSQQAGGAARGGITGLESAVARPFDLTNESVEGRLTDLGRRRLDPIFQMQREQADTQLRNQGVMPGTPAYAQAMDAIGRQQTDAYNQLLLTGRQQAAGEAVTAYKTPIEARIAELGGVAPFITGPTMPTAPAQLPTVSVGAPDYSGLTSDLFAKQLAAATGLTQTEIQAAMDAFKTQAGVASNTYNRQMEAAQNEADREAKFSGGLWGALGSIGGTILGGPAGGMVGKTLGGWAGGR